MVHGNSKHRDSTSRTVGYISSCLRTLPRAMAEDDIFCHFNFYWKRMIVINLPKKPWDLLKWSVHKPSQKFLRQFNNKRTSANSKQIRRMNYLSLCCCKTSIWVYSKRMLSQSQLSFVLLGIYRTSIHVKSLTRYVSLPSVDYSSIVKGNWGIQGISVIRWYKLIPGKKYSVQVCGEFLPIGILLY